MVFNLNQAIFFLIVTKNGEFNLADANVDINAYLYADGNGRFIGSNTSTIKGGIVANEVYLNDRAFTPVVNDRYRDGLCYSSSSMTPVSGDYDCVFTQGATLLPSPKKNSITSAIPDIHKDTAGTTYLELPDFAVAKGTRVFTSNIANEDEDGNKIVYTQEDALYNKIKQKSADTILFDYDPSIGPYKIGKLVLGGGEGTKAIFEPGVYFIDKFSHTEGTDIVVGTGGDGTGVVKLFIRTGLSAGSNVVFSRNTNINYTVGAVNEPHKLIIASYAGGEDIYFEDGTKVAAFVFNELESVRFKNVGAHTFYGAIAAGQDISFDGGSLDFSFPGTNSPLLNGVCGTGVNDPNMGNVSGAFKSVINSNGTLGSYNTMDVKNATTLYANATVDYAIGNDSDCLSSAPCNVGFLDCGNEKCRVEGYADNVDTVSLPDPAPYSSDSISNVNLGGGISSVNFSNRDLGSVSVNSTNVSVTFDPTVSYEDSNRKYMIFRDFSVGSADALEVTLNFEEGDYWFNNFAIDAKTVNIATVGKVNIFVTGTFDVKNGARLSEADSIINIDHNKVTPRLSIYTYTSSPNFYASAVNAKAYIYSQNTIDFRASQSARFEGSMSALGDILIYAQNATDQFIYNPDGLVCENECSSDTLSSGIRVGDSASCYSSEPLINTKKVGEAFTLEVVQCNDALEEQTYEQLSASIKKCSSVDQDCASCSLASGRSVGVQDGARTFSIQANEAIAIAKVYVNIDGQVTCSDPFAVRPDRFDINLPIGEMIGTARLAGDDFSVEVEAFDSSGANTPFFQYTATLEANETKPEPFVTGTLSNPNVPFASGEKVTVQTTYSEVGQITLTVKEQEGAEFASVDAPYADRFIEEDSLTLLFAPKFFKVSGTAEGHTGTFTYYNDDNVSRMGAHLELNTTAYNANNEIVKNYIWDGASNDGYAKDVTLSVALTDNSPSDLVRVDSNSSVAMPATTTLTLSKEDFVEPSVVTTYDFNFERETNKRLSPAEVFVSATATDGVAETRNDTITGDPLHFYYGRIHSPRTNSYGEQQRVHLYYEVFCDTPIVDPLGICTEESVDIDGWFIHRAHDIGTMGQLITLEPREGIVCWPNAICPVNNDFVDGNQSAVISYGSDETHPFMALVFTTSDPWLIYHPHKAGTNQGYFWITFREEENTNVTMGSGADERGNMVTGGVTTISKTGVTEDGGVEFEPTFRLGGVVEQDANVSKKVFNKRINW
jgi:hypothetical protein